MTRRHAVLAARIRAETAQLRHVVARAERAADQIRTSGRVPDVYVDSAALNLHDFYTGLERVFQQIAATLDGSVPGGQDWHRDVLRQMGLAVPSVRPAVLSGQSIAALSEYLGFRHVVRNVYAFELHPDRVGQLVDSLGPLFATVAQELEAFADFIAQADADSGTDA